MKLQTRPFGKTQDGAEVQLFEISDPGVLSLRLTNFGATLVGLDAPDRDGHMNDILLGYDALDGYLHPDNPYLGAVVGRYANRIASGRFSLDGKEYRLAINNGSNSLHGGDRGFSHVPWTASPIEEEDAAGVELRYDSPAMEEGYPGKLTTRVRYTVHPGAEVHIDSEATTDAPTIVNLSFHGYFNLAGHDAGSVLDHDLRLESAQYTPVNEELVPTGQLEVVDGTPMDFRRSTRIGQRIGQPFPQLDRAGGYDHNWVVDGWSADSTALRPAARVAENVSGRVMELSTTEPGLQFYSSNFLDGSVEGKGGARYRKNAALCLEPQHFPDSPNQSQFPGTVLRPGETYRQKTVYRFSVLP